MFRCSMFGQTIEDKNVPCPRVVPVPKLNIKYSIGLEIWIDVGKYAEI